MVKRGIEWSIEARRDLMHILDYYNKRNGSNRYSVKLNQKIFSTLQTIAANPGIGLRSNFVL